MPVAVAVCTNAGAVEAGRAGVDMVLKADGWAGIGQTNGSVNAYFVTGVVSAGCVCTGGSAAGNIVPPVLFVMLAMLGWILAANPVGVADGAGCWLVRKSYAVLIKVCLISYVPQKTVVLLRGEAW